MPALPSGSAVYSEEHRSLSLLCDYHIHHMSSAVSSNIICLLRAGVRAGTPSGLLQVLLQILLQNSWFFCITNFNLLEIYNEKFLNVVKVFLSQISYMFIFFLKFFKQNKTELFAFIIAFDLVCNKHCYYYMCFLLFFVF